MMTRNLKVAACFAASLTSIAAADICSWDWTRGNESINDAAGRLSSINASFDTVTNAFSWEANYSDQIADGYWLVVSPGPNPKGHAGELAILYADFSRATPVLTAYAYNGVNGHNSFHDGSNAAGVQAPDRILTSLGGVSTPATPASLSRQLIGSGSRISIQLDASLIQSHIPDYDASNNEWTGVAFGNAQPSPRIGIWMHSVDGLSTSYNDQGYLSSFNFRTQGWFDGQNFDVQCVSVPAPGAAALAGTGMLLLARRRRA